MDILEQMRAHRSVRSFESEPLGDGVLVEAVSAAQMASTSSHVQAYSVIQVCDSEARRELVELTGGQSYVSESGAFLVICGDLRRHHLIAARAKGTHEDNLETFLLAVIDASLFAQNLALAFEAQNLGVCFIGGLRSQLPRVDRLLSIPRYVFPLYGLTVGVPAAKAEGQPRPRLPLDAVLFKDRYLDDPDMLAAIDDFDGSMSDYYDGRGLSGRNWTGGILRKFAREMRGDLHDYYRSKGAVI